MNKKIAQIRHEGNMRRKRKVIIILAVTIFIVAALVVGIYLLFTYYSFSSYTITSTVELSSISENITYHIYEDDYLQCADDGLTYFNDKKIIWSDTYEMDRPIIDICGSYIAVADTKQNDIYLYDQGGRINRFNSNFPITDIEVSEHGIVAVSTNDDDCNYIELKDSSGNELINVKSIFSSSGYLSDICLSDSGTKLAATFIYVTNGTIESRILFYDFSKTNTDEMLVGTFSDFNDTLLTNVVYMNNDTICAIGDNSIAFYSFKDDPKPKKVYTELDYEIQTLVTDENYILEIIKDNSGNNNYKSIVYDFNGNQVADAGFDFAYSKAALMNNNILLYNNSDFILLSFGGYTRCSLSSDEHIISLMCNGNYNGLLLAGTGHVSILELK